MNGHRAAPAALQVGPGTERGPLAVSTIARTPDRRAPRRHASRVRPPWRPRAHCASRGRERDPRRATARSKRVREARPCRFPARGPQRGKPVDSTTDRSVPAMPTRRSVGTPERSRGIAVLGSYATASRPIPIRASCGGRAGVAQADLHDLHADAAAGLLPLHLVFLRADPRGRASAPGYGHVLLLYALVLVPSALWMPLTFRMLAERARRSGASCASVLALVGLGSVGLLAPSSASGRGPRPLRSPSASWVASRSAFRPRCSTRSCGPRTGRADPRRRAASLNTPAPPPSRRHDANGDREDGIMMHAVTPDRQRRAAPHRTRGRPQRGLPPLLRARDAPRGRPLAAIEISGDAELLREAGDWLGHLAAGGVHVVVRPNDQWSS